MVTSIESSEAKAGDALHAVNGAGNKVEVTRRGYAYDALGRPTSRTQAYPQQSVSRDDSFDYNRRSELTGAKLGEAPYAYSYDNIGNRITAQEDAESVTYAANNLNQYTQINTDGTAFVPEYDEDGNQTRVRTHTGIWKVQYNAQNRAIRYESEADSTHIITCVYDTQGRRVEKKEEKEGAAISHVRYVYRGYLQVAAYDLLAEGLPSLWQIIWDPTQEIATRPLAIRKDASFLTYGWDLTKNICETYAGATGFLGHRYAYSPYGLVSLEGDTSYQPLQWSSEVYDTELGLVYYNYRYYNPGDGRWTRREPTGEDSGNNLYAYVLNRTPFTYDTYGLVPCNENTEGEIVAIKSFKFTLIHCSGCRDRDITFPDPMSTIEDYVMDAITGKAEDIALNIVERLSPSIGSALRNAVSRLGVHRTTADNFYTGMRLEIVASRCCCQRKNNRPSYSKKEIKGSGYMDNLSIELSSVPYIAVTDQHLLDEIIKHIGRALRSVFTEAMRDLNSKTC